MALQFGAHASEYSQEDVIKYLNYTGFYSIYKPAGTEVHGIPPPTLYTLSCIMTAHLTSIPFENTLMHYDPSHTIDISPRASFERFVTEKKGGYCMQHGVVLLNILHALKFNVFSVAARVPLPTSPVGDLIFDSSPSHMVLLVLMPHSHLAQKDATGYSSAFYLVDTGFGGANIMRPFLVSDGHIEEGLGGQQHRLIKTLLPQSAFENEDPDRTFQGESVLLPFEWAGPQTIWMLQSRPANIIDPTGGGWLNVYAMSPSEYLQTDFEAINYVITTKPTIIFNIWIMAVQVFLTPDIDSNWKPSIDNHQHPDTYCIDPRRLGQHILRDNQYSKRFGTSVERTNVVPEIKNEDERIRILAGVFGLLLPPSTEPDSNTRDGSETPLPQFNGDWPEWAVVARHSVAGRKAAFSSS